MDSRGTDATPTVEGLVAQIRDIVNRCEVHYRASRDFATFAKLCTCMDTIEDAELAIDAFQMDPRDDRAGHNYLMVYGLFQAYVIQQDAVLHMCDALREALGGPFAHHRGDDPDLDEVRALRVEIVGHPTRTFEGKQPPSYHSISRPQMAPEGLQLMSEYPHGERRKFRPVFFRETTEKQARGITAILQAVLDELKDWQNAERAKHRGSELTSLFPEGYEDLFAEMQGSILGKSPRSTGESSVAAVRETMAGYEAELRRRGLAIEAYPGVKHAFEDLRHPVSVLCAFFAEAPPCADECAAKRAQVMTYFVEDRVAELRDMAREIDADYGSASVEAGDDTASRVPFPGVAVDDFDGVTGSSVTAENAPTQVPRAPSLGSLFRGLRYSVGKVQEGICHETSQEFGERNLELVQSMIDQILCPMRAHGLVDDEPSVVGELTFVLSMLRDLYGGTGAVTAQDATVYAWYLGRLIDELRAIAVRAGLMNDGTL